MVNLRTQSGPGDDCLGDQGGLGNKKIGQRPFIFPFYPAPPADTPFQASSRIAPGRAPGMTEKSSHP